MHNKSLSTDKGKDGYVAPTMSLRTSRAFHDEVDSTTVKESAFVRAEYDEHGYGTYYTYNYNTGVTETVKNAKDVTTTYGYDSNDVKLTSVTAGNSSVSYQYDGTRLSKVVFGSAGYDEEYSFKYDAYGNKIHTYIGDEGNLQLLAKNEYGSHNGLLDLTTYGNGDTIRYEYNDLGQKKRVFYNGSEAAAFYWRYDALGTPVVHQDNQNDRRYYYGYDSLGRLCRMEIRADNSDEFLGYVEQGYDLHNNVNKLVTNLGGRTNTQQYFYVANSKNSNSEIYSKDGLPSAYVFSGNRYATYEYDTLNRITERRFSTETALYNNYTYKLSDNRNTENGTLYRTSQLSTEFIGNEAYTYYYDVLGNITSVKKGTRKSTNPENADFKTVINAGDYRSYTYDNLSQLTREDNKTTNLTNVWSYDRLGNIQTKTEYKYTEDASITAARKQYIDYQYGTDSNTSFNKLLKNIDVYNGTSETKSVRYSINYDAIGNPIEYTKLLPGEEKATTIANLDWRGRQLMSFTDKVNSNTISYRYDADGLRASKTVNGAKTTYTYLGDKLTYQHTANADGTTNYELYFFYDSYGNLSVIQYYLHSGTTVSEYTYYVSTNAFGDVTGLYGGDGSLRVSYEYDAWGNVISVCDAAGNAITNLNSIAHRNPIRYRGYYYDVETRFYYLQSRYYCPKIGRFLNADEQLNDDIIGNNPFAYCSNNPVSRKDDTGKAWWCVIGAVVGGVVGGAGRAVSNLLSGNKWYDGVVGAVAGGAVGGAIASTGNVLAAAYVGAAVETLVNEGISYTKAAFLSGSKQKAPTVKNFVNSALSVGIDTLVNGTISCCAGEMTQNIVPKMVPNPAQMASVSFLSLETLQLSTESLWDMTLINTSEYVGDQLPQKPWQTQTIQLFPNEYVEEVA